MSRPTRRVLGEEVSQWAGLVIMVVKRSVRPWCCERASCTSASAQSNAANYEQATDLEDGIDVDLVRVGKTNERGLGRTFLELGDGAFHSGVL